MPTATIYSEADDGHIFGSNATYATARSTAAGSDDIDVAADVGQLFVGGAIYRIYRAYMAFDTSVLPAGAIVTAATLYICAELDSSTTDFNVQVYRYEWSTDLASALEANYDGAYGGSATLEGTIRDTSAGWVDGTYYSMAVDPAGVSTTDYTKYTFVSSRDVSGTAPTGDELVHIYSADEAGTTKDPYLEVTYRLPMANSLMLMGCGG